jgi:hypothetical protein
MDLRPSPRRHRFWWLEERVDGMIDIDIDPFDGVGFSSFSWTHVCNVLDVLHNREQ